MKRNHPIRSARAVRPVRPRRVEPEPPGYPSVIQQRLGETDGHRASTRAPDRAPTRRGFLRGAAAAAGAALVGGMVSGQRGEAKSRSPRRGKPHRVDLPLSKKYTFRYGNYQLLRAAAQTHDANLARFLLDSKERKGIEQTLRHVLDRHTCADVTDAKRLARLRRAVAKALAARYRARTRRRARLPTVVLFVGVPPTRCLGDCPAAVPICKAP